ncbi:MAG: hypothetical protein J7501_07640 [Bdellovibrio sp.]|nr:hypothetical protein [Bdellovibrio sp.]
MDSSLIVVGYFSFKMGQSSVKCAQDSAVGMAASNAACGVPNALPAPPVIQAPPPPPEPNSSQK